MSGLLVRDARLDGEPVAVRCAEGRVATLAPELSPEPGEEVLDAGGAHLVAALLNGHTHAAMTLFRGSGGDLPLMPWLEERIWPVEAKLDAEDAYWGARLACAEMLRAGTTWFWDMYWHPEATARAVLDAGIGATIGAPLFDQGPGSPELLRRTALECLEALDGLGPGIAPALAPHSIYMVTEGSLRWIGELAAERGIPVHIHLSETAQEVEACIAEHGARPAEYLDRVGILGPRAVLAHGVWLDHEELALIAERGATVVTNPVANMKLAVGGAFPYPAARAAGVAMGIGTDGAGSNDSLDLLADLKQFALIQKHAAGDATAVAVEDAWTLATGGRSELLRGRGRENPPAPLEVGAAADFLLLRPDAPELAFGELTADLVYAAAGASVDTVVAAGRVQVRGGELPGLGEIVARARERAARLGL